MDQRTCLLAREIGVMLPVGNLLRIWVSKRCNMAKVERVFLSWVSTMGDMAPGEIHHWWMIPTFYGDAVSVTAHAITGNPTQPSRTLEVEHVRTVGEAQGRSHTLLFNVRNAGNSYIVGYGIGLGFIRREQP